MVWTVHIAVRAETYMYDRPYTYYIPPELVGRVQPGMRVIVPFGRGSRPVQGLVLDEPKEGSAEKIKPILTLLDEAPVLNAADLRMVLWVREKCFCTCFAAFRAAIPAGIDIKSDITYTLQPENGGVDSLGESAQPLLSYIAEKGGSATLTEIRKKFDGKTVELLNKLVKKDVLSSDQHLLTGIGDKTVLCARLLESRPTSKRLTPNQRAVIAYLEGTGDGAVKEISYFTGASTATIKNMAKQGMLELYQREVFRISSTWDPAKPLVPTPTLNEEQRKVASALSERLDGKPFAALLQGVTGSGKTAVYLHLIEKVIAKGKQAIVLVPEISLTPQLTDRFFACFGNRVAVLHSALSAGERYDTWKQIRSGAIDVVVGTRSAVFAPLERIGLIVIDEEQEASYRSEQTPCYHARDVAKFRCVQHGALLLLGSATPSLESAYAAKTGKYLYLRLEQRYNGATLPEVLFADRRKALHDGHSPVVTPLLAQKMEEAFARGEQCILFLNRRGANKNLLCRACGHVPQCPNCSVALTYHSANNRMMCHYCGRSTEVMTFCPACRSWLITREGIGTQSVAEELQALFPDKEIIRMDADTTGGTNSHEKQLRRFRKEKIPILLGTQMITKGLDFENVTVVGVIDGDQSLYVPSFRAAERTFSMLTQVIGRAGRGDKPGVAVIQTYSPEQETLRFAAAQDYDAFYEAEIGLRKALNYPPFCDLLVITLSGPEQSRVFAAAMDFHNAMRSLCTPEDRLADPAPSVIFKRNNRYHYQIVMKTRDQKSLRDGVSHLLRLFMSQRKYDGILFNTVMNPMDV